MSCATREWVKLNRWSPTYYMLPTISWPQGAKQQQRVTGWIAFTSIPYSPNLMLILNSFLCQTINELSFSHTLLRLLL